MLRSTTTLVNRMVQQPQLMMLMSTSVRASSTVKFTKEHEYVQVHGKVGTCGITDFAQSQLGDVVYVGLPEVGASFKKGDSMASVESVKAASDVYAPVSGKVVEVNKLLTENPAKVNESAEKDAWFVKLEITNAGELTSLLDQTAYKNHCAASKH